MFDRASLKLGLDKAVLQSMSGRDNSLGGGGVSHQMSTDVVFYIEICMMDAVDQWYSNGLVLSGPRDVIATFYCFY